MREMTEISGWLFQKRQNPKIANGQLDNNVASERRENERVLFPSRHSLPSRQSETIVKVPHSSKIPSKSEETMDKCSMEASPSEKVAPRIILSINPNMCSFCFATGVFPFQPDKWLTLAHQNKSSRPSKPIRLLPTSFSHWWGSDVVLRRTFENDH